MNEDEAHVSKGRILVADDSPTVVNILRAMLENEGYEVISATDGIEAISIAYREQPDLIVLDIFMPKINGYQVCRLLKNDESTSHIPVIMLTGSERGDEFWSLQTGADEFRTKDFQFHGLVEAIERLLKKMQDTRRKTQDTLESRVLSLEPTGDEVQIMYKLSHLLDRELYSSTVEKLRLETILDNLGEGVFTVGADKRIIAFNKALLKMTGLSREQVLGRKCTDVVQIPLCSEGCLFDKAKNRAASTAPFLIPVTAETEIERLDGRQIPIDSCLTLLQDHVGKIVGAVCVCRDITRMKEMERMNDELSKAYMDLKSTQAQLIQSEKMASLGRLVAGATHELNNPISFIYSNISHLRRYVHDIKTMLNEYDDVGCLILSSTEESGQALESPRMRGSEQKGNKGADVPVIQKIADRISDIQKLREQVDLDYTIKDLDRLVDDINEGARRTKRIVEDLKAFSRSDEGKIEDTDINRDIEKSLSLLVDHYKDKVTIHRDYGDLPRVKCYAGQISQVFMNLIVNACQAIDGRGDMWITTRLEDRSQALGSPRTRGSEAPAQAVIISIRDNGVGIAAETVDKIFDPFFTTKDVGEGAGLGLSISYGIIERHKGKISVDSEVGSGTNFTIRLPVDFESVIGNP